MRLKNFFKLKYLFNDYIILAVVIMLSSFKQATSFFIDEDFATFQVLAKYISIFQIYSNHIIVLLVFFSTIRKLSHSKFVLYKKYSVLIALGIFQLLVVLFTEKFDVIRFFSIMIITSYFLIVVTKMSFFNRDNLSIVHSLYYGTLGFVLLNLYVFLLMPEVVTIKSRFFGVSYHPNSTGLSSSICFAISIILFFLKRKRKIEFIYFPFFAAICAFYICILTDSRTALGGCILSIFCLLFFSIRDDALKIIFVLLFTTLIILIYNFQIEGKIDESNLGERGFNREATWRELWDGVSKFPLLGKGKEGATANSYLLAIVSAGILGASFFYYTIYKVLKEFFSKNNNYDEFLIYKILSIVILFEAILEGVLVDVVTIPIFTYWILLCFFITKKRKSSIENRKLLMYSVF